MSFLFDMGWFDWLGVGALVSGCFLSGVQSHFFLTPVVVDLILIFGFGWFDWIGFFLQSTGFENKNLISPQNHLFETKVKIWSTV